MMLALLVLIAGLIIFGVIMLARYLDALAWRRSLVAYTLRLPAGLLPDAVTAWLGSISALTHASWWWLVPSPPLAIEITATVEGISHYLIIPDRLRGAVLASARAHLAGARIDEAPDYLRSRTSFLVGFDEGDSLVKGINLKG